jgi:hypothetical protein
MSTGGIFNLITNDGKQDRMLMASELLSQRLAEIKASRANMDNPNPTLSDIERTHILFMNAHFKPFAAMAYEYNKVVANNPTLGSKVQFSIPQFGDFFSDMVVYVKLTSPTVSFSGTPVNSGADCALFRWCDYPGERLFQKVSFDVNGNPLDEYYPDTYNMHRQFCVTSGKSVGWHKNMGHELPVEASYKYYDTTTAPTAPRDARASFNFRNGYQTYKRSHSDLEMLIPLLFWFNTDPRLAIPSVAIPYGQRFINIDLATPQQLLRAIINPGALSTTGLSAPTVTTPVFANFDLYINNIFVNPDIHDIFIARIGFTLIRVHRRQVTSVNKSSDNILLQQLKWPIETLYVGIRPTANMVSNTNVTAVGNQNSVIDANMNDWHKFGVVTTTSVTNADTKVVGAASDYILSTQEGHVGKLSITAHGVPLYNNLPSRFFNSYVPYLYGGWNVVTPTDPGLYMITFNLYPGTYQPSGHINVSRAREFYIAYDSTYVGSSTTADLVVNAVAINFLLVSDGSATLRYAT